MGLDFHIGRRLKIDPERSRWWAIASRHWAAILLAVLFVVIFYWLISRQFLTFDTRGADVDRFNQAIWNSLHGRFLYSTIKSRSLLANHFSPLMAALAPLLWIWEDPRIFSLVQTVGLAVAGLFLK
jgi:uncharacterized membrane protein